MQRQLIAAQSNTMREHAELEAPHSALRQLYDARELLLTWTRRDFRVRYSQSFLGAAWAVAQPLALMLIFTAVFSFVVRVQTDGIPYPLFSYTALVPWTLFANSLTFAIPSLLNNMNLVSKIYFPREVLPLSAVLVGLADFFIALILLAGMMAWYRFMPGLNALWLPLILVAQLILTFGLSLFLSALNVFYRDIRFIVPLLVQVWMYLSPVIYPPSQVPETVRPYYFLNPMAAIIDSYRRVLLLNQPPDWSYLGLAATIAFALLIFGYAYFKRSERRFADVI
jgi:lipopolysaccharide transport system permease protein